MKQLAKLRATRLWREQGVQIGLNIEYDGRMTRITVDGPDEDDLLAYLVRLRPFILTNEVVNLTSIWNLCFRHARSDLLRSRLSVWRSQWKQISRRAGLQVIIDDDDLISEKVFGLCVNSIFHTDPDKDQQLEDLDPVTRALYQTVFADFVVKASEQVVKLSWMVSDALEGDLVDDNAPG
jgi:hypothetical protein